MTRLTTESLARVSSRRPWLTIVVWVALIAVAGFVTGRFLADALTTDFSFTNNPEAKRAAELIERRFGEEGVTEVFILDTNAQVSDPGVRREIRDLQASATEIGGDALQNVVTFYDTKDPAMVSTDGQMTLMPVTFKEPEVLHDLQEEVDAILDEANSGSFRAQAFGAVTLDRDFSSIAEEDLAKGETIGIAVALVVLVLVFGALVAGLIPILMGGAAIVVAMGITALVGRVTDFSFFVTNMITMMGLAVGIDYSLFIVSRYREERARGHDKGGSIAATGATASRAVFFSGMTVVFALIGMLVLPMSIFRSLAAGAIFVVLAALAASLTLLPALLGLLGDKVNALRVLRRSRAAGDQEHHPFWDRITHAVMRRPVISLVLGGGLLLAAAFSYFDIDTGFSGVSTLPDDTASKRAFTVLATEFSGGLNSPVEIVVDGEIASPEISSAVDQLQDAIEQDGTFGPSSVRPNDSGDAAIVAAPVLGDPSGKAATDAVERLRERYVPAAFEGTDATVLVGGDTAFGADFFELVDTYTPVVFALVLGLSFLLLTVVFRSIVVPIKAILMNLLSVGAAYGLIVLVFQKGFLADELGLRQVETIEAWLPLFLFSVLFGLSMDYHVFLLSRIREQFDKTANNAGSVAYGLRTTGALITGAAVIMVAVFGGFAAGELVMMQQMGFGLAVAVFLDATIVRSVLVPASMRLLGDLNWYLPSWLRWLPDLKVEGEDRIPREAVELATP